jgi:hypothetical protein
MDAYTIVLDAMNIYLSPKHPSLLLNPLKEWMERLYLAKRSSEKHTHIQAKKAGLITRLSPLSYFLTSLPLTFLPPTPAYA